MNADRLSTKLASHFVHLEYTRSKSYRLLNEGVIVRRDIELIYKGLFFDVSTTFENFIERLFLGLLNGSITHNSNKFYLNISLHKKYHINKNKSRVSFDKHFLKTVSGKSYLDWMPYDYTLQRAQLFFKNGFPFSELNQSDREYLFKVMQIRNVLAHDSEKSRKSFELNVINGLPLTSTEKSPMGYLLSNINGKTRLEEVMHSLSLISKKLTS